MENIRQYLLSLICITVICAVLPEFFTQGSSIRKLVKFAAGILTMLVAMTPLLGNQFPQMDSWKGISVIDADYAAQMGQMKADAMLHGIIMERLQTYICDKAASMGVDLSVEVALSDATPPEPHTVILTGPVSPYAKEKLSDVLMSELAITEDQLLWK